MTLDANQIAYLPGSIFPQNRTSASENWILENFHLFYCRLFYSIEIFEYEEKEERGDNTNKLWKLGLLQRMEFMLHIIVEAF